MQSGQSAHETRSRILSLSDGVAGRSVPMLVIDQQCGARVCAADICIRRAAIRQLRGLTVPITVQTLCGSTKDMSCTSHPGSFSSDAFKQE